MGESAVDDLFADEMNRMVNPTMAPYAKECDCLLQITAKAGSEAEAEAILKVQQATADAIRLINEAQPGEGVLKIKALEAFTAAADGKATKIIIPSELQGIAGLVTGIKEIASDK